ncbi:NERD domain-containing protein [Crassaminicella profunda]|uniref:NERD domain-containing protein n=1 Tax=Crassaminicella profunda TaxID=1286698 RepID=UPI001CA5F6DC|nr:NERD domain-containing protein [Crassaminicella profunda]QZY55961.1 NERD domain-containing protein [Crassaminicella profunda]
MALFDKALDYLMGGKREITSPIFVKDFSEENKQLNELIKLSKKLKDGYKKEMIDRDITYFKQGIQGEKNVYFELKNSFLPILCLHDIRLKYDEYVAQFDYIIISNKFICILETKKLNGNITINGDGDFIRIIKNRFGKEIKREGMYSPVSQNERHVRILEEILLKENLVKTTPYHSLVVMANPKTIIDKNKCPENIKKTIYKYDQITKYLQRLQNDKNNTKNVLEKYMYDIANFLVENNTPLEINYDKKYNLSKEDFINKEKKTVENTYKAASIKESNKYSYKSQKTTKAIKSKKDKETLTTELKAFRLITSKAEKIKPYFIFNNAQMEDLIEKYPRTKEELLGVNGFGNVKVEKYGEEILKVFKGE